MLPVLLLSVPVSAMVLLPHPENDDKKRDHVIEKNPKARPAEPSASASVRCSSWLLPGRR